MSNTTTTTPTETPLTYLQMRVKLEHYEEQTEKKRKKWRENRREYYKENTVALLEYQRQWYIKNRAQIVARRRERRQWKKAQTQIP